jgi:putative SOS response-associated peptidase YedK
VNDGELFAFAGLWDEWKNAQGELVESCTILTTISNSLLADIHDRMPVILRQDDYELWLDPCVQRHAFSVRDAATLRCRADESASGEQKSQPSSK